MRLHCLGSILSAADEHHGRFQPDVVFEPAFLPVSSDSGIPVIHDGEPQHQDVELHLPKSVAGNFPYLRGLLIELHRAELLFVDLATRPQPR